MTKRQAENYARLRLVMLDQLGVEPHDFEHLLRIQMALHRWSERECNGEVETDDESGDAFRVDRGYGMKTLRYKVANRERGALKRLAAIMAKYPKLGAYHQSDPRGCALYVYERARLLEYRERHERKCASEECAPSFDIDSCYSSIGVALCY